MAEEQEKKNTEKTEQEEVEKKASFKTEKKEKKSFFKLKKKKDKSKKLSIRQRIHQFLYDEPEKRNYKSFFLKTINAINAIKIFISASKKFVVDDCFTKASAIAYTTMVSLIPTLTVVLTFYSIFSGVGGKKEEIFRRVSQFVIEHNIRVDIEPFLETISTLIDNARRIGEIGIIILIFTATAVLRTIHNSLNDIWKVKKGRSQSLQFVYFWAALTLGPLLVWGGTTAATKLSSFLSSPNYKKAVLSQNKLWVVGNKGSIRYSVNQNMKFKKITAEDIDWNNQQSFDYRPGSQAFWKSEFSIDASQFSNMEFKDVQFIGEKGWIVGKNGVILRTVDGGKNWFIQKRAFFDFNAIHMINEEKGFIVADSGYLLKTDDGGKKWEVSVLGNVTSSLNDILFVGDKGFIVGNRGLLLQSSDQGASWSIKKLKEAKQKKRFIDLNSIAFTAEKTLWIAGQTGFILRSDDLGETWINKNFKKTNYRALFFKNSNEGYIAGEQGHLIYTNNGGETWDLSKVSDYKLNQVFYLQDKVWLIGEPGLIVFQNNNKWEGKEDKSFFRNILNFITPFIFAWGFFLLIYLALPNIKIPFKPAAIGATFTAIVWVVFLLLFIVYVKSFAIGTKAVYGALAAIPLFLILVYSSAFILLFGAELSYTLMHPKSYLLAEKPYEKDGKSIFKGLSILYCIYKNFETGQGPTRKKEILRLFNYQLNETDYFLNLFKDNDLILEVENEGFSPKNASKNILLTDLLDMIHDVSFDIPGTETDNEAFKKYFEDLFIKMKKSKNEPVGEISLFDMIRDLKI